MNYTDLQIRNLSNLAEKIRDHYIAAYKLRRPQWNLNPKWDDKFWFSVAELVTNLQVDPKAFISTAFEHWNHIPKPPNMLKAAPLCNKEEFDSVRSHSEQKAAEIVNMSVKLFGRYIEIGLRPCEVISDRSLYFNDFMRDVFSQFTCKELSPVYQEAARAFLVEYPAFHSFAIELLGKEDPIVHNQ